MNKMLIGLLLTIIITPVFAGNMYVYKDKDGQVLLNNVNPSGNFDKFTKKVKVTYYEDTVEGKKYSEYKRQLATKPDARIGMTTNQILNKSNWGKPNDINTTIDSSGKSEQWIYGNGEYLYFKNGKLTSIHY